MKKIDPTTLLGVASMIIGVIGTLVSSAANKRQIDEQIAKEVAKALEKK